MRRAICFGLAAALAAGCGPTSRRLETPAPQDEVSVGYGTRNRQEITGAVTSVSPTEAERRGPRLRPRLPAPPPRARGLPPPAGGGTPPPPRARRPPRAHPRHAAPPLPRASPAPPRRPL